MYLGWIDYGVLVFLLGLSVSIGIYQGCFRSKQLTTNEFLIADGRMKILPTAMSLLASLMSAASLLGIPVEIYSYGTMYSYWIFAYFIGTYLTVKLFIPMFRQIGNPSIYAYLEQRFSLTVRIVITLSYIIVTIFYIAVILYGPSLALSQVTGLHIWLAVISSGLICTLYTSIGGMKAVIWTDVTQTIMMFLGVILSIIFGLKNAGGIENVINTVIDGQRLQFSTITLSPSVRYTVWSILFGGSFNAAAVYACMQTQAQRYLCVKNTRSAQKVAWTNFLMCAIMLSMFTIVGCLVYAKYHQCDPLRAGLISKPDQLYPLFVIETLGRFPGLTGLFIASILSASLSTVSSGVNSIATVFLEDIYKRMSTTLLSDRQQAIISKLLSVLIGLLVVLLASLTSYLGNNIIVIVFQISGSFAAPILGVFLVGFFFPRVNSRSVLLAFICCLIFQTWILLGASLTAPSQAGKSGRLATSVEGCLSPINISQTAKKTVVSSNFLTSIYSMSVMWYSFNAVFIVILVSLLGSLIFGSNDPDTMDKSLLISWKKLLPCYQKPQNTPEIDPNELKLVESEAML